MYDEGQIKSHFSFAKNTDLPVIKNRKVILIVGKSRHFDSDKDLMAFGRFLAYKPKYDELSFSGEAREIFLREKEDSDRFWLNVFWLPSILGIVYTFVRTKVYDDANLRDAVRYINKHYDCENWRSNPLTMKLTPLGRQLLS